jgi:hypothetical protein
MTRRRRKKTKKKKKIKNVKYKENRREVKSQETRKRDGGERNEGIGREGGRMGVQNRKIEKSTFKFV